MLLQHIVIESAEKYPDAIAVKGPDGSLTYSELNSMANQLAFALVTLGVQVGDRVAIWAEKSNATVVAMQGILRAGAVYVPIDPTAPSMRAKAIMRDCQTRALITTRPRAEEVLVEDLADVPSICIDGSWQGLSWENLRIFPTTLVERGEITKNDLAYILYTSGSTGVPKGVMISHLNALAFIEWAVSELKSTSQDRFSNHAPFHFDLSVLDLYAAFLSGATVIIIPESIAYFPKRLFEFIQKERPTIWYSVPSVLVLLIEQTEFLQLEDMPINTILFAGEPFALKHLRRIRDRWTHMRLLNLYGPTETNVCTFYEVTQIPEARATPVPIGKASCGDRVWAVKPNGQEVVIGEEGELMVSGPTVMLGYWGKPAHQGPYATGDIVRLQEDENYVYLGRRDHMVKMRGHRIELGDIEAALLEHPTISEAAVVVFGSGLEARLVAFLVSKVDPPLSLLAVKQHCAKRLPRYMIIDEAHFVTSPPRTSTGKVDRKSITEIVTKKHNKVQG